MPGNIDRLRRWLDDRRDVAMELIRVYLGVGLFVKGVQFLANPESLGEFIEKSGGHWAIPAALAHLVVVAHLVGGFFLAIGFLTRLAALLQVPVLAGAVFFVHVPAANVLEPREGFEFAALVLFLLVVIALHGPGPWSVDLLFARRADPGGVSPGR